MTRHAAYALYAGKPTRHPFATFPHADAARRWVASHPDAPVRFVPALPDEDDAERASAFGTWAGDDGTLGACGCVDYHAADCPTRTGGADGSYADHYARLSRPDHDDYYDADDR
jgi:hypothetical protein